MDSNVRGWISIVIGLVAGYFVWSGNTAWAIYALALGALLSGWHHAFGKHKK